MSLQLEADRANNVYYTPVNVVVNDQWVTSSDRNIALRDIRSTCIITVRYAVNWPKHLLKQVGFLAVASAATTLLNLFYSARLSWALPGAFAVYWAIRELWAIKQRASEHILELSTLYGRVEIARSDEYWYLLNIAREIGRRLNKAGAHAAYNAVYEPSRSTILIASEPPGQPKTYEWADLTIARDQVTIHGGTVLVEDILRAGVRKHIQPLNLWYWIGSASWALALAINAFIDPYYVLLIILMLVFELFGFGIISLFIKGVREWQRTHKYTVIIETRTDEIELSPTSNLLVANGIASNINRNVKENMLAPPPVQPQLETRPPTRRT